MSQPLKKEVSGEAAQAAHKTGIDLLVAGKVEEAIKSFHEALRLDINLASAWANLGIALRKLGKLEASAACSQRAIALSPQNPFYHANYGNCLIELNRQDEAFAAYAEALRCKPDEFTLRYNYALSLRDAERLEEAAALLEKLLKEKPGDVEITWDAALTQLQLGNLKDGWEAFEIRWQRPSMARERVYKTAPRWHGEDISGKTVLVYEEQGFGDTILCSRYIPLIAARGGKVILECKPQLHKLFSTINGITRMAEAGQVVSGFDYHVPMMSLPRIFNTGLSSIPSPPPLLYAAPALSPASSRLLALGQSRLKVGIVWSGNTAFLANKKRAVDITRFLPLAAVPNVQLYSLQKGPCEKDIAACGAEGLILPLGPELNDFSETAAVLKQLDLVIMTDSSVAHLAGSIGCPVWNLLSVGAYWLYLREREDSPWYSSMRLFRQPKPGDWDSVFKKVAAELEKAVALKKSGVWPWPASLSS